MNIAQTMTMLLYASLGAAGGWAATALAGRMLKDRGADHELPVALTLLAPLVFGIGLGLLGLYLGYGPRLFYLLLMSVVGLALSITDIKKRIIPNELVLAIFLITGAFALSGAIPFDWRSSGLGLVVCLVLFLIPALLGNSVGMGDIKLAAAVGFASGLMDSLYTIIVMGGAILLLSLCRFSLPLSQRLRQLAPMGPFIAGAFLIVQVAVF